MSARDEVKCAYCGRERVPVTKKGNMKPHVQLDGRPCLFVGIPHRPRTWPPEMKKKHLRRTK